MSTILLTVNILRISSHYLHRYVDLSQRSVQCCWADGCSASGNGRIGVGKCRNGSLLHLPTPKLPLPSLLTPTPTSMCLEPCAGRQHAASPLNTRSFSTPLLRNFELLTTLWLQCSKRWTTMSLEQGIQPYRLDESGSFAMIP